MKPVILCVDDEKFILESLKEQLLFNLKGDFTIETAESAEDALEILEELFDDNVELGVIISDYIMPGMKGDKLLATIHQKSPKTLKILLTGQADLQAVSEAVNKANLYRYITKPWESNDLAMTVKEALISFNTNQKLAEQNDQLKDANKELATLNSAYQRFVPREFLNFLGQKSITDVQLGDQKQYDLSILFADIRSFTALSEEMTPQENFNFLNSFLKRISPCIRHSRGFIDKYMGDGLMALFPEDAGDAISAAVKIQQEVAKYNEERKVKNRKTLKVGIGIHQGRVMMGTIGEAERMESTVISDAVNISARLERIAKEYDAKILVSESTLRSIDHPENFTFRYLHKLKLRGKTKAIQIVEILNGEEEEILELKMKTLDRFKSAHQSFHEENYRTAVEGFEEVLSHHPEDKVTQIFLQEAKQMTQR